MGFFDKLFGEDIQEQNLQEYIHSFFGRYTDANKTKTQLAHWKTCQKQYKNKEYIASVISFLQYLQREGFDNVFWQTGSDQGFEFLQFDIIQGSRIIHGYADSEKFVAETHIAEFSKPSAAVMRKLLNLNFGMHYARFALFENIICVKFVSNMVNCVPGKMYAALKELATFSDKYDDLLLEEFKTLQPIEEDSNVSFDPAEAELKLKYLNTWVQETLDAVEKLDDAQQSGAISYKLLSLAYRIDYLLLPQGILMNEMEKIQSSYFGRNNKSYGQKNQELISIYRDILKLDQEQVLKGFYRPSHTFGVLTPASNERVWAFIKDRLPDIKYYREFKDKSVVFDVLEYIAGYALFNYGMYESGRNLMDLIMHILHPEFYEEMGVSYNVMENDNLNKSAIENFIKNIRKKEQEKYPNFQLKLTKLSFDNKDRFVESVLKQFENFNYSAQ